jgi:DNA polymerase type B, organellar and viral
MKAYYGGHVDMYIPQNLQIEDIYHYDVNYLYPSVMKQCTYPGANIKYFVGNPKTLNLEQFKCLDYL